MCFRCNGREVTVNNIATIMMRANRAPDGVSRTKPHRNVPPAGHLAFPLRTFFVHPAPFSDGETVAFLHTYILLMMHSVALACLWDSLSREQRSYSAIAKSSASPSRCSATFVGFEELEVWGSPVVDTDLSVRKKIFRTETMK